jgi:hypothetical protein
MNTSIRVTTIMSMPQTLVTAQGKPTTIACLGKIFPTLCKVTIFLILQEKLFSSSTKFQAGKQGEPGAALHKLCCYKKAVDRRSEWWGHK